MCLIVKKDIKFKVAQDDILAYKMLSPTRLLFSELQIGWENTIYKILSWLCKGG